MMLVGVAASDAGKRYLEAQGVDVLRGSRCWLHVPRGESAAEARVAAHFGALQYATEAAGDAEWLVVCEDRVALHRQLQSLLAAALASEPPGCVVLSLMHDAATFGAAYAVRRRDVSALLAAVAAAPLAVWDSLLKQVAPRLASTTQPLAVLRDSPGHPWQARADAEAARQAVASREVDAWAFYRFPHWGVQEVVEAAFRERVIGVAVHDGKLLSTGCIQNAYFLVKALSGAGLQARLVDLQATVSYKLGGMPDAQVVPLNASSDLAPYHTVVFATRIPAHAFCEQLRRAGVRCVGFMCANTYMLDVEDWVLPIDVKTRRGNVLAETCHRDKSDELWHIPMLHDLRHYYSALTGLQSTQVPHLWDHELLQWVSRKPALPMYQPLLRTGAEVVIMEPNVSIVKTSWLPLMVCEWIQRQSPNALHAVHVMCQPKTDNARRMVEQLQIGRAGKVQSYPRVPMVELLERFVASERHVVFLSHQTSNALNYLHYELLYMGFPLVHNSPLLKDVGYFYEGEDVSAAATQVRRACVEHVSSSAQHVARGRAWLQRVNPADPTVQSAMLDAARGAFARNLERMRVVE
jgi:hypothetical protein